MGSSFKSKFFLSLFILSFFFYLTSGKPAQALEEGDCFNTIPVVVTGSITDASGISEINVTVDGSPPSAFDIDNGNWIASFTGLGEGPHTLLVVGTDACGSGNTATTDPLHFKVDTAAVVSITYPVDGVTIPAGDVMVTGTADNDITMVIVISDQGHIESSGVDPGGNWSVVLTGVTVPSIFIAALGTDDCGNIGSDSVTVPVIPPVCIISSVIPTTGCPGDAVTITGTTFGDTPGSVSFDSVTATITSWDDTSIIVEAPGGDYSNVTVTTAAADLCSLVGPYSYDNAANVKITSPVDGETIAAGDVMVTGTADTDITTVIVISDEGHIESSGVDPGGNWSVVLTGVTVPSIFIAAVGTDDCGNVGSDSVVTVLNVNCAPSVTILSPQDGNRYDPNTIIGFAGEADDFEDGPLTGASLVWSSNIDGQIGTGTTVASQLSLGPHTITLTATDSNGAQDSVSITVEIRDDLWTHYTYANEVVALTQDGNFIWAGTTGGVVKWNILDVSYVKYTTADGLAKNIVAAVALDAQGNKWFGVTRRIVSGLEIPVVTEVSKFDGVTWTNYFSIKEAIEENYSDVITTLYPDRIWNRLWAVDNQNNVWIKEYSGGVSFYNGSSWTTYTKANSGLIGDDVICIVIDNSGNKWFGTRGSGVSRFDGSTWTTYTPANTGHGLSGNSIITIYVAPNGDLWFSTWWAIDINWNVIEGGLSRLNGGIWTNLGCSIYGSNIFCAETFYLTSDAMGNIWTGGSCVGFYDGSTWTKYSGLFNSPINSIVIDSFDNKWFAHASYSPLLEEGLVKYDNTAWTPYLTEGIGSNFILAAALDLNGEMWFGTPTEGAYRFDGTNWTKYRNPPGGIKVMFVDSENNKWFGGGAISVFKFDNIAWEELNDWITCGSCFVRSIAQDVNGDMWFGTGKHGLTKYDGINWTNYNTYNSEIPDDHIDDVGATANGNIWVLTPHALSRFDGTNWVIYFEPYDIFEIVENNYTDILTTLNDFWIVDDQNNVWLKSGLGAYRYDGSTWTNYITPDGLVNNDIKSISFDSGGNVWFGTMGGVSKFDGVTFTNYTKSNSGLQYDIVDSVIIDSNNHKWFLLRCPDCGICVYRGD